MYPAVIDVHPEDNYMLSLVFADKTSGILDMKPYLDFGVFRQLKDARVFARVHVSFDTIEWDCGADLDPEFVHAKALLTATA